MTAAARWPALTPPDKALRGRERYHAAVLILAVLALIAARFAVITPGERIAVAGVELPGFCLWRKLTGGACLTCGTTRSLVDAAHGRWTDAWSRHPLGLIVGVALAAQIPYRGWRLLTAGRT